MNRRSLASAIIITLVAMVSVACVRLPNVSLSSPSTLVDLPGVGPPSEETRRIVASGWIEGRTANIEMTTRLTEQINEILVSRGDWVREGDILIKLDASRYKVEEELARAELAMAQAKLLRIESGFRETEVEAARKDFAARVAELEGAQRNLARLEPLLKQNNVSQQTYDEGASRLGMLKSLAEADHSRLKTMEAPPRVDDLLEAKAAVAAAQSHLSLAALNVERTQIYSPIDGRILRVNVELGELAQPSQLEPLVTLSDVRNLRAVVEVDEYDALSVQLGQYAIVTTNGVQDRILARGSVVEIEPQMSHKQMDTSRPGMLHDTFVRRVWVDLPGVEDLPIGLPVEVSLQVGKSKEATPIDQSAD